MKLLENIFSIKNKESKNNQWYKVVRILGLKLSFMNNALTQRKHLEKQNKDIAKMYADLAKQMCDIKKINEENKKENECINRKIDFLENNLSILWQMQRVKTLHSQVFPQFKNIHAGKDVVVVATGPSLNDYVQIENAIHIGVNSSIKSENVELDYLFMQDYKAVRGYIDDVPLYKNQNLIRFYGIQPYGKREGFIIPESFAIEHNALRYYVHSYVSDTPNLPDVFAYDLCSEELYGVGSTVFSAINFALWTNPKRIYLVGCDCSSKGHFNLNDNTKGCESLIQSYMFLKKFATEHYPDTEIISVNPVGLRGVFKDIYTENYSARIK